eukprot:TRINITY_DN5974_c0_g2_i1.p1 TRINITY_DN5974_c0_g2~~TRINITY_DN5974_c0_g2_i1.p1  ORF type:complete len:264 (+),score=51.56 TRINITY_DN5974_c0_g2_i1:36-794(+)
MTWNPLKKNCMTQKPALSQGLASYEDERTLELTYNKLQELEENTRKVYKEVKTTEECLLELHKAEDKLASDLCNSQILQEDDELKSVCNQYGDAVYQMGHRTEDLVDLSQRTVVEPLKKLSGEFPQIQNAVKRRDLTLAETLRAQNKFQKQDKLEKTGQNIVKTEQLRKGFQSAKDDFEKQNRLLVMELPELYERRVDYFQPSLQALVCSQVDYFGECTTLFSRFPGSRTGAYEQMMDKNINQIKSLSIVNS